MTIGPGCLRGGKSREEEENKMLFSQSEPSPPLPFTTNIQKSDGDVKKQQQQTNEENKEESFGSLEGLCLLATQRHKELQVQRTTSPKNYKSKELQVPQLLKSWIWPTCVCMCVCTQCTYRVERMRVSEHVCA